MPKRTSSKDFLKGYEAIWKNGPTVKYTNPDSWSQPKTKLAGEDVA